MTTTERHRLRRSVDRLTAREADLRAGWRASDPTAALMAETLRAERLRLELAINREQDAALRTCAAPSLPLFEEV